MQAVNFTSTDIKIHQAIRHEWESFQAWLSDQNREQEMLFASQRRWGKMKAPDKQQILELQESARTEWLARVRQSQLHLEHWVMTPNEKQMLQQTLGWTPMDMVNAYAMEQAKMGPMYQRVDPGSWGTKEPGGIKQEINALEITRTNERTAGNSQQVNTLQITTTQARFHESAQ
ncbi:Sterol regulatory element binding protein cleavage-activating protein [Mycena venus]|uniref:Sterol regulatory element binding protein cleavage-activating protein n=1 Tax=Mycena venus TaxID=2733690 RepID=A0A8H6X4F8_9AGAR|nr:Sterol regulatory element binding protein cleavage-activating protein [Mycena venus]